VSYVTGYTTGVFDLFHIGHLNVIRNSAALCDHLIVGVTVDELAADSKGRAPVIPFLERAEIVRSLRFVTAVVPQFDFDKVAAHDALGFDVLFVGDDWKGTARFEHAKRELSTRGVKVVYFPYTRSTSSTILNATLEALRNESDSSFDP